MPALAQREALLHFVYLPGHILQWRLLSRNLMGCLFLARERMHICLTTLSDGARHEIIY